MGRGRGGYCTKQIVYYDSNNRKVTDKNAIFVAERYMDQGYEVVFRRTHEPDRGCDLTIKTSDDLSIIKNIEVKGITSKNPSMISERIKSGNGQIKEGDTIAIYLPNLKSDANGKSFALTGLREAHRKGLIKGPIEFWFSDRYCVVFSDEDL